MSGFYIGIALLIISLNTKAQFSDNFTDNSLETNPVWVGEITKFSNTNGLLQLNGISESDEPRIFTASKAILNATWEGKIYLDVNPSSVNYAEIFLLATDTSASFSAYSLRFGGSADNISLIKTTSGNRSTKNASGASLFDKDSSSVHFRALLNADTLLVEIDTLGNGVFFPYLKELISLDISPQYFGVGCRHTATRKDKFRFDDFVVTGTQEKTPPKIVLAEFSDNNTITINFSENIDTNNIVVNPILPVGTKPYWENQSILELSFTASGLAARKGEISLSNILDLNGNSANDTSIVLYNYQPAPILEYQLLITEILPDPSPSIGLPETEFIEIYNNTNDTLYLDGLAVNGYEIPNGVYIAPTEYHIFYNGDEKLFPNTIKQTPCPNFPTFLLSNNGGTVVLSDAFSNTIDSLTYSSKWYKSKPDGRSLERNNLEPSCTNSQVFWQESVHTIGGTPAEKNSLENVKPSKPILQKMLWLKPDTVSLIFNQSVQYESYLGSTLKILASVFPLTIRPIAQCGLIPGELISIDKKPQPAIPLINEVLFNPKDDGVDFIEFKTQETNAWLFFDDVYLIEEHSSSADTIAFEPLLFKTPYLAITEDKELVLQQFYHHNAANIIEHELMNLVNDGGVLQVNVFAETIDSLPYNDSFQSPYLINTEGVSLERNIYNTNPFWFSSPEHTNFGSPGLKNASENSVQNLTKVTLEKDILDLQYDQEFLLNLDTEPNTRLDFQVYNLAGMALGDSWSFLNSSAYTYDLLANLRSRLNSSGVYILLIRVYGNNTEESYKLSFSLK